jgi:hypothetical protein
MRLDWMRMSRLDSLGRLHAVAQLMTPFARRPQARHWMTPVTDEEYDATLQSAPHLCRPFASAIGDLRSARECTVSLSENRLEQMCREWNR